MQVQKPGLPYFHTNARCNIVTTVFTDETFNCFLSYGQKKARVWSYVSNFVAYWGER